MHAVGVNARRIFQWKWTIQDEARGVAMTYRARTLGQLAVGHGVEALGAQLNERDARRNSMAQTFEKHVEPR